MVDTLYTYTVYCLFCTAWSSAANFYENLFWRLIANSYCLAISTIKLLQILHMILPYPHTAHQVINRQHLEWSLDLALLVILGDDLRVRFQLFQSHRRAKCGIQDLRMNHPNVTLLCKFKVTFRSTSTHCCQQVKRTKWFGTVEKAVKRIWYTSESRSRVLYIYFNAGRYSKKQSVPLNPS